MAETTTQPTPAEETQPEAAVDQQKIIADHEATIEAQKVTIEDQQKIINESANTIETQKTEIEEQKEAIGKQTAIIKQLQSANPDVKIVTPVAKKKPEMPKEPVEYKGKKYRFRFVAFYYKAVRYEAQDAALDEKLIADILSDENQGILIQVY